MSSYAPSRIGIGPVESGGSLPPTGGFSSSPIESRSGGSLPSTGGFGISPIEMVSGGSLPGAGFGASPIEQSGGSLPPTGLASIYSMFFGD